MFSRGLLFFGDGGYCSHSKKTNAQPGARFHFEKYWPAISGFVWFGVAERNLTRCQSPGYDAGGLSYVYLI
jgi:hypothetical protein